MATAGVLLATVLCAALVAGLVPRARERALAHADSMRAWNEASHVNVTRPTRSAAAETMLLPASVQPGEESFVFARTTGYVRAYHFDLGDTVKAGDVLAEIDAPEVEHDLRQARAVATRARAVVAQNGTQMRLEELRRRRQSQLGEAGMVSRQDVDDGETAASAQKANVVAAGAAAAAAGAGAMHAEELKNFTSVVAPFDGIVTQRSATNGQLVSQSSDPSQALFRVTQIDMVRVFATVPQGLASSVKIGNQATVLVKELPQRTFVGTVVRTSNSLDSATRTLTAEVEVRNTDHALLAGMYAQMKVDVKSVEGRTLLPASAVPISSEGPRVAIIRDGQVHWQKVQIGGDVGDRVVIVSGVQESDVVAMAPSDKLVEGLKVIVDP